MVTHIVFFKLMKSPPEGSPEENEAILLDMLRGLPQHIPQVQELEAGKDFSDSPASYDIGLITRFSSREDLETYRIHPEHQKVVDFIQKTTEARAVVDFETT